MSCGRMTLPAWSISPCLSPRPPSMSTTWDDGNRSADFRRQLRLDQRFHLPPYLGITLNLRMRPHQQVVEPGISLAIDRFLAIVNAEISHDLGVFWIRRANLRLPMDQPVRLI